MSGTLYGLYNCFANLVNFYLNMRIRMEYTSQNFLFSELIWEILLFFHCKNYFLRLTVRDINLILNLYNKRNVVLI